MAATLVWSFVVTFVLAKIIDATIGPRVVPDQEAEGLDVNPHAEAAWACGDFGSREGSDRETGHRNHQAVQAR